MSYKVEQVAVIPFRKKPFVLEKMSIPDAAKTRRPELRLYHNDVFWDNLESAEEWHIALGKALKVWRKEQQCLDQTHPLQPAQKPEPHRKKPQPESSAVAKKPTKRQPKDTSSVAA